ncbi:MAG: glycosyltransferase [Planctomycetota bacterium]
MAGGGSERQMLGILHHLNREAFEPFLYLVNRTGELLSEIPDDIHVSAFWDRHAVPAFYVPGLIHRRQVKDFERVVREFDIDVICDRTHFMTLIAGPVSRRRKIPRVSFVDCQPECDVPRTAGRFIWIKRWLLRRAYSDAETTIAVASGVRKNAIEYFRLPPEKVQTIYNMTDVDRIDRLASEAAARDDSLFRIICAGRLHEQKGYPYLIDALDELVHQRDQTQLRLDILGVGPEEEHLRKMVEARQLGPFVRFVGFRDNPYKLFREAHLFCLPSLYEGLPTVLLDAIACRIPVLATDCESGPREVLADGKYGTLVPTRDSRALADAISDAVRNYAAWTNRTIAAREHLEQNFSTEVVISRIESTLTSICTHRDNC